MPRCPCCGLDMSPPIDVEGVRRLAVNWTDKGKSKQTLLERLAKDFGKWVPTPALVSALYGHRADGGPDNAENIISVFIWSMRDDLKPFNLTIEGKPHWGRRLKWFSPVEKT